MCFISCPREPGTIADEICKSLERVTPLAPRQSSSNIQVKLADKPGSVVDSHSSRRFVT
jgi:hypothetical protein